jgi:hypothetical protein
MDINVKSSISLLLFAVGTTCYLHTPGNVEHQASKQAG